MPLASLIAIDLQLLFPIKNNIKGSYDIVLPQLYELKNPSYKKNPSKYLVIQSYWIFGRKPFQIIPSDPFDIKNIAMNGGRTWI